MSIDTASYADLLVMVAALKEENERLNADVRAKSSVIGDHIKEICRLEDSIDSLKARVAELESIIGSDELKLVLSNYKNSTLVPRHYRICESILKKIEILSSVAVRDSGCSRGDF